MKHVVVLLVLPVLMADSWICPSYCISYCCSHRGIDSKTQMVTEASRKATGNNLTCYDHLAKKNNRVEIKYWTTMGQGELKLLARFGADASCTSYHPCTEKGTSSDGVCGDCGDPGLFQVLTNISNITGYSCSYPTTDYIYVFRDDDTELAKPTPSIAPATSGTTQTSPPPPTPTVATTAATPTQDSPTKEEKKVAAFKKATVVLAVFSGTVIVTAIVKLALHVHSNGCPKNIKDCLDCSSKMLRPKVGTTIEITSGEDEDRKGKRTIDQHKIEEVVEAVWEVIDL